MNKLVVSPTSLNLLRECPRCFWLSFQGVKRPSGPWPTFPRELDSIIKRYSKQYRSLGLMPPLLDGVEGNLVPVCLRPWDDPETRLKLTGILDECVALPNNLYAPLDYKSRGSQPNGVHEAYQLQLDAYTQLLEGSGYQTARYGLLVYIIPRDGELHNGLPLWVHVEQVETDPERTRGWMQVAKRVLNLTQPPLFSSTCDYCRWVAAYRA